MYITIDQLLSYTPLIIGGKKYWKMGSRIYMARINFLGMVELTEVSAEVGRSE